jgi:UDP-3-O-[3-hydroxymyristoyl] glucosamine N-acyltransferase
MNNLSQISSYAVIGDNVRFGYKCIIEDFCVIGKPYRSNMGLISQETYIGNRVILQTGTIVYAGASIADDVICTDYCIIYPKAIINKKTKIHYRAEIHKNVSIGSNCRIGGFLCNDTIIGESTTFYGKTVHVYDQHGGDIKSNAPRIGSNVIVAFGAVIVGELTIGDNSYIGANSIITKNVPENSFAIGFNNIMPIDRWNGRMGKRKRK